MRLPLNEIARIAGAPGELAATPVTGYSIDSRTIKPGELFFAIRGPRFDGHDFVPQVLKAGAAAAVVETGVQGDAARILRVPSTQGALEALAGEVRRRWGRKLVAVTGSAGKTTTKEMIASVLGARLRVLRSEGNFNNQYGLPLSLLWLDEPHEAGVFELGMSAAGEIAALARVALPDIGVVTCVAPVHLEFFDGIEGIAAAKRELIEALPDDGTAVLNADDPLVARFADGFRGRVITFGVEQPADFRAGEISSDGLRGIRFAVDSAEGRISVALPVIGRHNVLNALAALAAGSIFGIEPEVAASALAAFRPAKMRGEIIEINGVTLVNDCYNSNPRALEFMLEALSATPARGRRIAVLGEMRELGAASEALHRESGRLAASAARHVIGVAGNARHLIEGAHQAGLPVGQAAFFDTAPVAGEYVASLVQPGDVVLFKASRGVKLEGALDKVVGALKCSTGSSTSSSTLTSLPSASSVT